MILYHYYLGMDKFDHSWLDTFEEACQTVCLGRFWLGELVLLGLVLEVAPAGSAEPKIIQRLP